MENPRPTKVAVVDEVREKLSAADAVLLTEYRGLKVSELAELRNAMRPAGGEYRIYKNTLVRRAVAELELGIDEETLTGPTALAFVTTKADGTPGDLAAVAKTVQDFAKTNPLLVLKGGVLGETVLDADGAKALASLPTASEVYARLAGAINSGARGLASAVSGVHRSIAYVLQAAIEAGAFEGDAPVAEAAETAEAPAEATDTAEAPAEATDTAEAPAEATDTAEAPAEATDTAEAPAEATDTAEAPAEAENTKES
jgi:large subunit ribosomal protein L10